MNKVYVVWDEFLVSPSGVFQSKDEAKKCAFVLKGMGHPTRMFEMPVDVDRSNHLAREVY